ncbi:MAG: hypothetical protein IJ461_09115 [Clostridia bacterium]|nr:hypothetical protein [Clostridia bacterium]
MNVEQVASLAKIRLTAAEKEAFEKDMADILAFADQLNGLSGVDLPLQRGQVNVLRRDEAAPARPEGMTFQVPGSGGSDK